MTIRGFFLKILYFVDCDVCDKVKKYTAMCSDVRLLMLIAKGGK
jgi:hypothetical protein